MKKILCILLLMSVGIQFINAQSSVAIGDSNPKASAVLYLKGSGSQGFIIPIVANTSSIATPESGMIVYNSGDKKVYYHDGAAWIAVGSGSGGGSTYTLSLTGNNLLLKDASSTVSTVPIAATAPTAANQFLTWDGSKWVATAFTQDAANVNGTITVNGIKGKAIPALPSTTQVLVYNGSAWVFQALTGGTDSQDLTLNSATNVLSLTNDATTVDLSAYKQNLAVTGTGTVTAGESFPLAISSGTGVTIREGTNVQIDQAANVLTINSIAGGSGTVTNVAVTSANGFSGAVSNATTTPAITLTTPVTGILKGNGTAMSAATNADLPTMTATVGGAVPTPPNNTTTFLRGDGTFATPAGGGTLTAVSVSTANGFSGTSSGGATPALTLTTPITGILKGNGTAMSAAVATDFPTLNQNTTGTASSITGNIAESQVTNLTTDLANKVTGNAAITAGTNTKITYDAKGLVTAGAALTATDLPVMTSTVGGAVPTPPNNTTTFLRGDGTFATPAGGGTVTSVSVMTANGVSGTVATPTSTPAITLTLGAITPTSVAATGAVTGSNLSGTNTGDNAVNSLYSGLVSNATHTGDATGATALQVRGINGVLLSGLGTGILKNTTGTGVPSIATGADLPAMTATVGGAVPTPPNNTTTFLRGDGTFAAPVAGMTNPLTTTGDIIYGVGTTPTRLAGATGVLKSTGAAAPTWGAVNLANTDVTGTLPVANGGTGGATWSGLLLGSGSTIGDISTGTPGQILRVAGSTPTWSNFAVTSADITDGQITGADLATNISISTTGNITTSAPGNLSIAGSSTLAGATTLSSLSGAGTRMVVADAAGLLSTSSVPTAGWGLSGNSGTTVGTNFMGTSDNVGLSFKTNNLQRMLINNDGRIMININNTNIPALNANAILDIVPNGAGIGNMVLRGSFANQNDPVDIEFRTWDGSTALGKIFMNPSASDLWFEANGATRLALKNDGDVGIGTTNPTEKLDVVGNVNVSTASTYMIASSTVLSNTGTGNIFVGTNSGLVNTAISGTFVGIAAGRDNTTGTDNTFIGRNAGLVNTAGTLNVMVGSGSGQASTGSGNTFVGYRAGFANIAGVRNTLIGREADVSASGLTNSIAIGYQAVVNASNKVRLGDANITVIEGQVAFTAASDRRFKTEIKDIDQGLDFISKLRPVSYKMKNSDNRTNWGFIAQDIEALVGTENAVLTVGQDTDRTLGLRYTDFVAPLVKSIQEQQAQIEELKKIIASLEAKVKMYESSENSELAVIREQIKKLSEAVGIEANADKKK